MANEHPAHGGGHASAAAGDELAGVVDLGTNTALLAIGKRGATGQVEVLEERCLTPRLGEGLARSGRISPRAAERGLGALRAFLARMEFQAVPPARRLFAATAVLRRAANARDFVRAVRKELGLELLVLGEEEEAGLAYEAATAGHLGSTSLVIDVGGGSSELTWDGGRKRVSLPVGAVVLTELHPDDADAQRATARSAAARLPAGLASAGSGVGDVILLGGSAIHLASLERGGEGFSLDGLEGRRVSARAAGTWAVRLSALHEGERRALPIEAERAAILPAGLEILAALLERVGAREARVTLRGLRHALLQRALREAAPGGIRGTRAPVRQSTRGAPEAESAPEDPTSPSLPESGVH